MGRRGVSPIIATLLLVAITIVGGSFVFIFAQGTLDTSQFSGTIPIESISILGYDARDAPQFKVHDGGNVLEANSGGNGNGMYTTQTIHQPNKRQQNDQQRQLQHTQHKQHINQNKQQQYEQ